MNKISLEQAEYIAHRLACELMEYDEPLPDFSTRYPGKLESCLEQPFQTFGGKDLYPSVADKAAILFYLITKNHPFENGNKRMAVTITLVFLFLNDYWLNASPNDLYKTALDVAKSDPTHKDVIIKALKKTIDEFKKKRRIGPRSRK